MDLIVDYQNNDKAIKVPDKKVVHIVRSFMQQSTIGCHICVQWRDDLASWKALKDLKESNPFEIAEYKLAKNI